MNTEINEDLTFSSALTLKFDPSTSSKKKIELEKKLLAIEKLSKENSSLQRKLEDLQIRMAIESHPLLVGFCNARINNLEILEENLGLKFFKRKEREKIILMLIEGATEIWRLGDTRAARYLNDYLPHEEEEEQEADEKLEEFHAQDSQESEEPLWERAKTKAEQEEDRTKFELKVLYRELVKAFHPDKEMDEDRKKEKNLLMKRITEAYENQDIYALLKLEAEYLGHNEPTDNKIAIYLRELNEKLKALKEEKSMLTKWGPLAAIYQTLYSKKASETESNIQAQLDNIRYQIHKEESCSSVYLDHLTFRRYLRELSEEAEMYSDQFDDDL